MIKRGEPAVEEISVYEEQNKIDKQISEGLLSADNIINRNYLIDATSHDVLIPEEDPTWANRIRLFQIKKIVYDKKENVNDKLISVFASLQNIQGSVLLIIEGKLEGVNIYIGVKENPNTVTNIKTSADVLKSSFLGNFPGSELVLKKTPEAMRILEGIVASDDDFQAKTVSNVTVIPSMRDKEKDKFVQGLEKFIDTMRSVNQEYCAILISTAVSKDDLELRKRGLEDMCSALSPLAKTTLAYGENTSNAVTEGTSSTFTDSINENISNTNGTNTGTNSSESWGTSSGDSFNAGGFGFNSGKNHSKSKGYSSGQSWSRSVSRGTSQSTSTGTNTSTSKTDGSSLNMTVEHQNKSVMSIMEKIDAQLKRIKNCESFGIWEHSGYFVASDVATSVVAANAYKALMSGEESDVENSFINTWSGTRDQQKCELLLEYIKRGTHPLLLVSGSATYSDQVVTPSTMVSGKELPILMGLPQKSVSGVSVSSIAEFGRNVVMQYRKDDARPIELGCVHHMGVDEKRAKVNLDVDSFTSHCFVTGSTGSGKSNTTYGLLHSFHKHNIPFLVIEPAKGEYKDEFCNLPDINIFTTNPRLGEMLKLNPFRFNYPEIHILEHLDRLIEIFNACWEMYAAMPAILKDAVERIYIEKGWDLLNSKYINEGTPVYPTFQDLVTILPKIIDSSSYSSDAKGDYTGALVTRVTSLTNGISGQIFCDCYDIDDSVLFDQNTIVDLSRVGSSETKSLIMGILVLKLTEYRMAKRSGANSGLKHITVMEEAHNLLKYSAPGAGSNVVRNSVEMICTNLAEMRTYGEGFVIVDQSPSAVDIAAIKNTNTKIVMRLPEKNDREAVGNAIGLDEDQIKELSKLAMGKAAVMQNNWLEAVLTSINKAPSGKDPGSFTGEVSAISDSDLKEIRGTAIETIMSQFANNSYNIETAQNRIDTLNVSNYKKSEFKRCVIHVIATLDKIKDEETKKKYYYNALLNISGARNLFAALDRNLREARLEDDLIGKYAGNYYGEELNKWQKLFAQRLTEYITIKNIEHEFVVESLLRAEALEKAEIKEAVEQLMPEKRPDVVKQAETEIM